MATQTLHPAVVIEYLGDRDKTITPSTLLKRIFTKNPAFGDQRVIKETDAEVFKFCMARPQLFRRREDLEQADRRKDLFAEMSEHIDDYADIIYPVLKARLIADGTIVLTPKPKKNDKKGDKQGEE